MGWNFRASFTSEREGMKTLLILRHAKSSWKDEDLPDHERPLNRRGQADAPQVGSYLRQQGLLPDLILCSTAKRARATAELMSEALGYRGELRLAPEFYAAPPEAYLQALAGLPDDEAMVMVVGHNPGLEELVHRLTGEYQPMPTAALAQVQLPIERWAELSPQAAPRRPGRLAAIWRPKEQ